MLPPICPKCHGSDVKSVETWRVSAKVTEPLKRMWACSNPLCLFRWDDTGDTSTDRQSVSDYIRACESLLQSSDLSDHEQEVVEGMTRRMLEEMFPSGDH